MLEILGVALATVVVIEAALRSPLAETLRAASTLIRRSAHVLRARGISDHWKERILPSYSVGLLAASLKLAVMLTLLLAVYTAALSAAGFLFLVGFNPLEALVRPDYALWAVLTASLYLPARRALVRRV